MSLKNLAILGNVEHQTVNGFVIVLIHPFS
jgi:hypothetical protein